jgi:glycosyltransferase involved in cell wall biosynthesis
MAPYKGIDVLLEAAPAITAALPDATITLAGSGISRRLASTAEATKGVQLHDRWVNDSEVGSFFGAADIVVLPYTSATQSAVIPIAAAFRLPVIASAVGGLSEQLDHGRYGVLVPPADPSALANAVVRLWFDPARALAIGSALHGAYLTERSWPRIADSFARACRKAIRKSERGIPVGRV